VSFIDSLRTSFGDLLPFPNNAPPAKSPEEVKPRANERPYGQSGRVNFSGFIQYDELNPKLTGNAGLRVFDEMYREDPDIKRNVSAIWTPIQAATWTIEPHGGDDATDLDRKAAELCKWAVFSHMSPNWHGHLATLGPVLLRSGYCPFEQIWDTAEFEGKTVTVPKKLDLRLPRTIWRFYQDDYGDLTGVEQFLPNAANVYIPATELCYYRLQTEGDNWVGTSLLRQAYKPWFYKSHFERIDAIGQERKAVGVPVVYPPQNATVEVKEEMEKILASLHVNDVGYIMAPGPKAGTSGADATQGWTIDVITFDSSSGDSIQASIANQKQAIAAAFLADFLELGHHQVGARATAQVQEDPFLTAVEALGGEIKHPGNELLARIAYLNVPGIKGPPTFKMSISDVASLSEIAGYVQQLVAAGAMEADPELEDYLRERADLPAANSEFRDEKEELRKAGQQGALAAAEETPQEKAERSERERGEGPDGLPMKTPQKQLPEGEKRKPDAPPARETKAGKTLDVGDGKWWESMLSQGKLVEALDGARDEMQRAATPAAVRLSRSMAQRGKAGRKLTLEPPQELVDALQSELTRLYKVGEETVGEELAKQRLALGAQLASPGAAGPAASLLARARKRARIAAQNVAAQVARAVERQVAAGVTDAAVLQRGAEEAATGALRAEAVANAATSINDGRRAAAMEAGDVTGGIYTAVLDNSTCDECELADDGIVREPDDPALEVPNPNCAGGERCRCMVVWVLSDDPAAIGAIVE
jgi:hypothetical protein